MTGDDDDDFSEPPGTAPSTTPSTPSSTPPEPSDSRPRPDVPRTDLSFVVEALAEADAPEGTDAGADAIVVVGDRFDDDLRYLTRFGGPDRDFAVVVAADRAVLCAPTLFNEQATREFVDHHTASDGTPIDGVAREVRAENLGDPAGDRAAAVVADLVAGEDQQATLLVPQSIPHDAAVYLESAGHELSSTTAVADARLIKTDDELDCLRRVQRATARGMARAETVLAESDLEGDELVWNGGPLSTERLRRQVNETLAAYGVRDAGNTVIGAGPTAADLHYTGVDAVRPGETVLLDVSPRGPHGYYGDMTRTFVVAAEGGWERRAYVACEAAREAALAEVEAGATAGVVHTEAAAELTAYGFDPNAGEGEAGFTHGTGHGVGVSLHEGPSLSSDTELEPGHVVTVEPGVYDPEQGGVRLEDLVAVTEDGYEILHEYPFGITPERS